MGHSVLLDASFNVVSQKCGPQGFRQFGFEETQPVPPLSQAHQAWLKGRMHSGWTETSPQGAFSFFSFSLAICFSLPYRVSLCCSDCPGTHYVDQAGLRLTENCLPLSAFQVQGLKACTTTPGFIFIYSFQVLHKMIASALLQVPRSLVL